MLRQQGQVLGKTINHQGITQLVSASEASELNLLSNGYHNLWCGF